MQKGKVLFFLCVSFVGGIFIDSFARIPHEILWGFFILGLIVIVSLRRDKRFIILGACLLLFVLGAYRHQQKIDEVSELARYNDRGAVSVRGVVSKEPDVRLRSMQLVVTAHEIITQGEAESIRGNVQVSAKRYPEYRYGDEVELTGELKTPTDNLEGFDYQNYLQKDGIYSVIAFPEIKTISEGNGNMIMTKILDVKDGLRNSLYKTISPPESEILGAILLGDKRKLSEDLKEKLNVTGTRHITAISGMHIAIISNILLFFFISLGLWRHHAFYASTIVLILFIVMVGAPASAVRAGVMGGTLLLSQNLGRPKSAPRAILYAALIMLFINPLLLRFDVGFQLSFLAVMGIALFSQWFSGRLTFLPDIFQLRGVFAMTLSAQLLTLPILVTTFGRLSLVSLPANILIVPLIPFIMIGGFFSGLGGIISEPLGRVISWPIWLVLKYTTSVIDFFAGVPLASLTLENVHWLWAVPYYLVLFWSYKKFVQGRMSTQ